MPRSNYTIPAGQVLTVTPIGNVQVYVPGAVAGGFLASATSYGPYSSARTITVDGNAAVTSATFDPAGYRGTFVANGASAVAVNNANVLINDVIIISLNTVGGTVGALPVLQTITNGSGFTVKATAGDTSVYNYGIVRNAT